MAEPKEHVERNKHNLEFAKYIHDSGYDDWEITGYFYAALHLVNFCLHKIGITDDQISDHRKMQDILDSEFSAVANDYKILLSYSWQSRYNAYCANIKKIANKSQILYNSIENTCKSFIKNISS